MKSPASRLRAFSLLRGSQYLFLLLGVLTLSYVAFVWFDARLFQEEQGRLFAQQLREMAEARKAAVESPAVAVQGVAVVHSGALLGRIEIPAVGISAMILEGLDNKTLQHAVGHIPGTALPGQQGNIALAAHRDTFFRGLRDIGENDEITLTTPNGSTSYRVESTRVVKPEDIEVLDASNEAILTLVTCYPFELVGPAPRRFIVRAHKSPGNAGLIP
jgi:sortase A